MSQERENKAGRILVVDDEEHIRKVLSLMLGAEGYTVDTAGGGEEALAKYAADVFDLVFLDLRMPDLDGLEVLGRMRRRNPDQTVVMITAYASVETALTAMKQGAYDYIGKPFKEPEILAVVEKALGHSRLVADHRLLLSEVTQAYDFSNIIGNSPAMRRVFDVVRKVAGTKAGVLISGESGTGKELVARAVHYNSPLKDRPLVAVNCAAIPASLIESELFGHVKGAFTGAHQAKQGLFEQAAGSSLFLDEIGELPLEVQAKLLRALQDGEIKRVGDTASRKVDLRIIAATNKDLAEEVKAGKFREDLFYRLNVIPVHLPPLHERRGDIPLLVRHFLKSAAKRHSIVEKRFSPQALQALGQSRYPGNVRQLQNMVEQAAIMSEGELIELDDLPLEVREATGGVRVEIPPEEYDLKKVMKMVGELAERQVIGRVLDQVDGNRTKAAERLGISRRALITKIQDLGL